MKRRKFSVDEWVKEVKPNTGGTQCRLCDAPPDVAAALERIAQLRKEKRLPASQVQVVAMLRAEFGFQTNHTSLMRHFRDHRGIAW
jgi:hypothetical protein